MNPSTILVSLALIGLLALAARSLIKARKTGCGGGCAGCASQHSCHSNQEE